MAYLHCHHCHWSQDDFWDWSFGKYGYWWRWRYNPISCFLSYATGKNGYLYPRYIAFDRNFFKETGLRPARVPFTRCLGEEYIHSWRLLVYQFWRMVRKLRRQVWWTYPAFKRVWNGKRWPDCPECGQHALDID